MLSSTRVDIAEEGDLRLVDETTIASWVTGRLEIFFEGSWGQVCQAAFGAADATVACRQLGLGAGSVAISDPSATLAQVAVSPEVVVSAAGCSGQEERLLDCPGQGSLDLDYDRGCRDSSSDGLRLACVSSAVDGALCPRERAAVSLCIVAEPNILS